MMRSVLKDKSYQFALDLIKALNAKGPAQYIHHSIENQLIRSGTSIGANIHEAIFASSKADFIHKLSIAQKECSETIYWLNLMKDSQFLSEELSLSLLAQATELMKMLISSLKTAKGIKS